MDEDGEDGEAGAMSQNGSDKGCRGGAALIHLGLE